MAAKIRAWRAARVSPAAENSFPMLSIVMPRRRRLPVPGPSTLYQGRSCGEMGTRWKTEEAIAHLSCYISFVQKKHWKCVENPLIELAVQRTMQFAPQCDRYLGQFWLLLKLSIVGAALLLCYQNIYKWAMIVESRKFHRDEASC